MPCKKRKFKCLKKSFLLYFQWEETRRRQLRWHHQRTLPIHSKARTKFFIIRSLMTNLRLLQRYWLVPLYCYCRWKEQRNIQGERKKSTSIDAYKSVEIYKQINVQITGNFLHNFNSLSTRTKNILENHAVEHAIYNHLGSCNFGR